MVNLSLQGCQSVLCFIHIEVLNQLLLRYIMLVNSAVSRITRSVLSLANLPQRQGYANDLSQIPEFQREYIEQL